MSTIHYRFHVHVMDTNIFFIAILSLVYAANIYAFESNQHFMSEIAKSSNMSCGNVGIEESCIILKSNVDFKVNFHYQSMVCEKCSFLDAKDLRPHHFQKIMVEFASQGTIWKVTDGNDTLCSSKESFLGEHSAYSLYINDTGCSLITDREPEFIYTPILIAIGVFILIGIIWMLGGYLYRKEMFQNLFNRNSFDDLAAACSTNSSIEDIKQKQYRQRLRSLDTVRGIAIVIMIFVNYGGGKYWFFDHSPWNGLTFADLVFPWFIWMMGMSMALSIKSQLRKAIPKKKIFFRIIKRSCILFALGIMLNTYCLTVNLNDLRIPGVLQRFAVSYFVVATVHLIFASADDLNLTSQATFRDIIPFWGEWVIMLLMLFLHLLLTFLLHDPKCPKGYLGPGGLHDDSKYAECTGGAAGYIDRVVLGNNHLYQKSPFRKLYNSTLPNDPEGILGNLTSIFLVFLGLQAGKILLMYKEWKPRVTRWMIWAVVTGSVAAMLCGGTENGGWIPVNKNLWSVSFILATGSLAFALMSICYLVIDVLKWWSGAPLYYSGMNSILLYVGHSITHHMFPWKWEAKPTHMNQLFMDLWGTSLWVIISMWLYYKDVFITV